MTARPINWTLALVALLLGGAAQAADGELVRLSPEEVARIQSEAEATPPVAAPATERPRRRISGEVGVSIGSGSQDVYGAIDAPFGADARPVGGAVPRELPQRPQRRNLDRR